MVVSPSRRLILKTLDSVLWHEERKNVSVRQNQRSSENAVVSGGVEVLMFPALFWLGPCLACSAGPTPEMLSGCLDTWQAPAGLKVLDVSSPSQVFDFELGT